MKYKLEYEKEVSTAYVSETIKRLQEQHYKDFDEFLESVVRTKAVPPIKGDLTKGKIKWRGIKLCQRDMGAGYFVWLEQRGKQIGGSYWTHYPKTAEVKNGLES